MDISHYQGAGQFGKAYGIMLENDTHALGSVDRVLAETMVRLCADTAEYLYTEYSPTLARYEKGSRPLLEGYVADAVAFQGTSVDRAARIVDFCQSLGERAPDDLDEMRFGGTEERSSFGIGCTFENHSCTASAPAAPLRLRSGQAPPPAPSTGSGQALRRGRIVRCRSRR